MNLSYYPQEGSAGRNETFAEVFALLNGGPANAADTERLKKQFPQVISLLQKKLN